MVRSEVQVKVVSLKLTTGEELVSITYDLEEDLQLPIVRLIHPIAIKLVGGKYYYEPYCSTALNNMVTLTLSNVISYENASISWSERYMQYLMELGQTPEKIRYLIQLKMGHRFDLPYDYVPSVH